MRKITEKEARSTVIALTGEDILSACTGGYSAHGIELVFSQDEDTGAIVINDKGAEIVWEYDFHNGHLRRREYGSSSWVPYARIQAVPKACIGCSFMSCGKYTNCYTSQWGNPCPLA